MIELAAIMVIIFLLARAVIRAMPWILVIPLAALLATYAPLAAWQSYRDALMALIPTPAVIVMLPAWAFGVGLARTLWPLYVNAKRRQAHQNVDRMHDAMLS